MSVSGNAILFFLCTDVQCFLETPPASLQSKISFSRIPSALHNVFSGSESCSELQERKYCRPSWSAYINCVRSEGATETFLICQAIFRFWGIQTKILVEVVEDGTSEQMLDKDVHCCGCHYRGKYHVIVKQFTQFRVISMLDETVRYAMLLLCSVPITTKCMTQTDVSY